MVTTSKYWNTLRYLRPVQLYGRLWYRLRRPRPNHATAPVPRSRVGPWAPPATRRRSLEGPRRFRFLNETHTIAADGWDDSRYAKLWIYNLHYFDDLNARSARERRDAHRELISQWVAENPAGLG